MRSAISIKCVIDDDIQNDKTKHEQLTRKSSTIITMIIIIHVIISIIIVAAQVAAVVVTIIGGSVLVNESSFVFLPLVVHHLSVHVFFLFSL